MKESDLTEFEIEEEGLKLKIRRGGIPAHGPSLANFPLSVSTAPAAPQLPAADTPSTPQKPIEDTNVSYIKSPMVGTFYQAASPSNPPFVKPGDKIQPTSVVCILEAMKVMNEIHAELKGSILEVLVQNGQTVEYGQPLFKVKQD